MPLKEVKTILRGEALRAAKERRRIIRALDTLAKLSDARIGFIITRSLPHKGLADISDFDLMNALETLARMYVTLNHKGGSQ